MVTGRGPTTQKEASAAPDAVVECIGIDNLIGEGRLAFDGPALYRHFGATADPPDYRDRYLRIDPLGD